MLRTEFLESQPWAIAAVIMFEHWAKSTLLCVAWLPASGSDRRYLRMFASAPEKTALCVYNPNAKENEAFIRLSSFFKKQKVRVPEVYDSNSAQHIYLIQDLGDDTLLDVLLKQQNPDGSLNADMQRLYEQALSHLAFMQAVAAPSLPADALLPATHFDQTAMTLDFHYFKYCFLMPCKVAFDEHQLESDFARLTHFLSEGDNHFFLFRDFQARNILVHQNEVYFIDYQGAKWGGLGYDAASLLLQAKAQLNPNTRSHLLNHYIQELKKYINIDVDTFVQRYHCFELLRMLQVLGAYGFKGYIERKPHFLQSIPFALQNLKHWLLHQTLAVDVAYLRQVLLKMIEQKTTNTKEDDTQFKALIQSFSFPLHGVPEAQGFVFDCRCMPDPYDNEKCRPLTGLDPEVETFMWAQPQVQPFLNALYTIVQTHTENAIAKGLSQVVFNFGCVGGKHRSVFFANQIAHFLRQQFPQIKIIWR